MELTESISGQGNQERETAIELTRRRFMRPFSVSRRDEPLVRSGPVGSKYSNDKQVSELDGPRALESAAPVALCRSRLAEAALNHRWERTHDLTIMDTILGLQTAPGKTIQARRGGNGTSARQGGKKLCGFGIPERTSYLFHKRVDPKTCAGTVTLVLRVRSPRIFCNRCLVIF